MAVLKYTALRLLLFLAVAALLYAVGVRNLFVNAMLALLISGLVSLFVLDRARNEVSAGIERRIGDRPNVFARLNARIDAATRAEDAADDAARAHHAPTTDAGPEPDERSLGNQEPPPSEDGPRVP